MNGDLIYVNGEGETIDIKFNKDDPEWDKGDIIPLSLILDAAKLNMDEPVDWNEKEPLRKTGGVIFLTIIADNVRNCFFPPCEPHYRYNIIGGTDTQSIMQPVPLFDDSPFYGEKRFELERRGIKLVIEYGGRFGRYSFSVGLLTFVSGLGLSALASSFTDFLMKYVLPLRSEYYNEKYQITRDYGDYQQFEDTRKNFDIDLNQNTI